MDIFFFVIDREFSTVAAALFAATARLFSTGLSPIVSIWEDGYTRSWVNATIHQAGRAPGTSLKPPPSGAAGRQAKRWLRASLGHLRRPPRSHRLLSNPVPENWLLLVGKSL
jgi:hypothetical protein